MIWIIGSLAAGILAGRGIRGKGRTLALADRLAAGTVYLLIFLLDLSVGENPAVVTSIVDLGLSAAVLTVGAVAGSLAVSYPVYVRFFKSGNGDS